MDEAALRIGTYGTLAISAHCGLQAMARQRAKLIAVLAQVRIPTQKSRRQRPEYPATDEHALPDSRSLSGKDST
jgi:hypothetical protein